MIQYTKGNILNSHCEVIVVPVNCIGVMGAGLAKQVADLFPEVEREYVQMCELGIIDQFGPTQGISFRGKDANGRNHKKIFALCPTKKHFKSKSTYTQVEFFIEDMCSHVHLNSFPQSVAIPALGCGLGGLLWNKVKKIYDKHLHGYDGTVYFEIYEPNTKLNLATLKR